MNKVEKENMNRHGGITLFDRKFWMNMLRNKERCPKCRAEYTHSYDKPLGDMHVKSNRPFLLPCNHSMCENCVYQNHSNLVCHVCLFPIQVPVSRLRTYDKFQVREVFDLNYYLLSEIYDMRFYLRDGMTNNVNILTEQHRSDSHLPSKSPSDIPLCSECEHIRAVGKCNNCKGCYCKVCFSAIHKRSKVLKTHTLIPLQNQQNTLHRKLQIPRPKNCRLHMKVCDRYCNKCHKVCCGICLKHDHKGHNVHWLFDENQHYNDELLSTLDTVKVMREQLGKAQKDVKAVEMQLGDFAIQTSEDISNYFTSVHNNLQNEERRIRENFQNLCSKPQAQIRDVWSKLHESQSALNMMRNSLECYVHRPPSDIRICEVLKACNEQLEHLQCQVQISKIKKNPFVFKELRDIRQEFPKYYCYTYDEPHIAIRIAPVFGDINRYNKDISMQMIDNAKPKEMSIGYASRDNSPMRTDLTPTMCFAPQHLNNHLDKTELESNMIVPDHTNALQGEYSMNYENNTVKTNTMSLVRITNIVSPERFYVREETSSRQLADISRHYKPMGIPSTLQLGKHYMVFNDNHKQWCRGLLKKILPKNIYRMFLIDYGVKLDVSKEKLSIIDEQLIAELPGVINCGLFKIAPNNDSKWNKESNDLLLEISNNSPMRLCIIETKTLSKETIYKVDLIIKSADEEFSLRESFLYTGMAREPPDASPTTMMPKKMLPMARLSQRLPKLNVQVGDIMNVRVTHIDDPQHFYIIRADDVDAKTALHADLNHFYGNPENAGKLKNLYIAHAQGCCAVQHEGIWYRGTVLQVQQGTGKVCVRFVDEGGIRVVHWRQLFVLETKFRLREFTVKCGIIHVEPLQKHEYSWTDEAVEEFRQLTANPMLQVDIHSVKHGECLVTLHIAKKRMDINVGALLAKYGHCESTGEASKVLEIHKSPMRHLPTTHNSPQNALTESARNEQKCQVLDKSPNNATECTKKVRTLKRVPIIITHVVSPSEFYIRLANLEKGSRYFHQKIQEAKYQILNKLTITPTNQQHWSIGDHCFVRAHHKVHTDGKITYNSNSNNNNNNGYADENELYRGVITSISSDGVYKVFLRDIGATLDAVNSSQLYAIAHAWDMVANTVTLCHLACVKPTGGLSTWSSASIDFFIHTITSYSELAATQQGEVDINVKSMPIVLWGATLETVDPLAPSITKYLNINRMVVDVGLAHLIERLDATRQVDCYAQLQCEDDAVSIDDWYKNFGSDFPTEEVNLLAVDLPKESNEEAVMMSAQSISDFDKEMLEIDGIRTTADTPAPKAWMRSKEINKTLFAAVATYVDYDCVIYLHDAEDKNLLNMMRDEIKKAYDQHPPSDDIPQSYGNGQACVVRYHLDEFLYRGIVQELLDTGEYNVLFIDYGNVEACTADLLLPYAPFPRLPRIAAKFCLDGIRAKHEDKDNLDSLDQIHKTLVGNLVQVRVLPTKGAEHIKFCTMSLLGRDVAQLLCQEGYAEHAAVDNPKSFLFNQVQKSAQKKIRSRENKNMVTDNSMCVYSSDDEDSELNQCLDKMLERIYTEDKRTPGKYHDEIMSIDNIYSPPASRCQSQQRHIFQLNEYKKIAEGAQHEDLYDFLNAIDESVTSDLTKKRNYLLYNDQDNDDDNDADVLEMEQSLFSSYWSSLNSQKKNKNAPNVEEPQYQLEHNAMAENTQTSGTTEPTEAAHSETSKVEQEQQDFQDLETSEFDKFQPNETSSVLSHFSGIERFKFLQLPTGLHTFNCTLVSIITPTAVQLFPQLAEFKYRDLEMQRLIKQLAKTALPLTEFRTHTMCLARYSKDMKWYRALVRSYNPVAQQADVLYVDYLNSESLPVKQLRKYPLELGTWPLRTLCVRLHGLKPNPRMRSLDLMEALHAIIFNRELTARIECVNMRKHADDCDLMSVTLYDAAQSRDISNSNSSGNIKPITDSLIHSNYFSRI